MANPKMIGFRPGKLVIEIPNPPVLAVSEEPCRPSNWEIAGWCALGLVFAGALVGALISLVGV